MLGEAARTEADAKRYRAAYAEAIAVLAPRCTAPSVRDNPGVSVKLSALHPRYEFAKRERVMAELVERTLALARDGARRQHGLQHRRRGGRPARPLARRHRRRAGRSARSPAGTGSASSSRPTGTRAGYVIDWVDALAEQLDRRIMVRLVKGAYWDAEIKRAQVLGLDGFPVFTRKAATDVSYIANARKLLEKRARIYPQFATHNAHTVAAVLHLAARARRRTRRRSSSSASTAWASGCTRSSRDEAGTKTRIYAPVGRHADLLAYLVRRLLENGANGSFVNMIADRDVPAADVVRDPLRRRGGDLERANGLITPGFKAGFPRCVWRC